ncbi:alpha/beta-hydrolase [Astrocystis sublimbata]|nr:alpha/beta-hydrolase [Astrocystis sublimbata]KAI0189032.1 alpha/beta-hydrolase [Astrocystis sublimbata]
MVSNEKPTIILVSGAFHTPQSYQKLTHALETYGYEVHVPRLPTCNEARPPNADLASDTELVRRYVETLVHAGRTVIAIGHSYGGQVVSNALCSLGTDTRSSNGLTGGVSKLIFMVGYALDKGKSTADKFKEFGDASSAPLVFDMAEDDTMVVKDPNLLFGLESPGKGITEEEVAAYRETLCRWNGKGMLQPLENESWREIDSCYIYTQLDVSITLPEQESMVKTLQQTGREVKTASVESGHCPNFSAVQAVADAVNGMIQA